VKSAHDLFIGSLTPFRTVEQWRQKGIERELPELSEFRSAFFDEVRRAAEGLYVRYPYIGSFFGARKKRAHPFFR